MDASKFEAESDEVEQRRPTHCPFCGQDGSFDGQGQNRTKRTFKDTEGSATFIMTWYISRCGDCNGRFQMLEDVVEVNTDE